jgi:hypothetical protein
MDRACDTLLGKQKQYACWHGGHLVERAHAISVSAFWNVEEYGTRGQFPRMDVEALPPVLLPILAPKNSATFLDSLFRLKRPDLKKYYPPLANSKRGSALL